MPHRLLQRLVLGACAAGAWASALAQDAGDARMSLRLSPPANSELALHASPGPAVNAKSRGVDTATGITVAACATCASEPTAARPLISALPAGESFEVRVLKGAVTGFRLRATEPDAPSSPDERLRLRISRQHIGLAWQTSF